MSDDDYWDSYGPADLGPADLGPSDGTDSGGDYGSNSGSSGGGSGGKQYTFSMPRRTMSAPDGFMDMSGRFGGKADLNPVVRNFQVVQTRMPDPPKARRLLPGEAGAEAFISWGKASDFFTDEPAEDPVEDVTSDGYGGGGVGGGGNSHGSKSKPPKKKPQDKQPGVTAWDEIDRQVRRGKVYNPDDADQWVEVEQITSMRFRGPGGRILKLNFKPPPFPSAPSS